MSRIELIKGSDLKLKLKKKKISQQDICKEFGYNANTVSRYLSGEIQMPASFILNVAVYAGFNISDLIEGEPYIIDIDHTEVAAEPQEEYKSLPPAPPPEVVAAPPLIHIDTASLESTLTDMQSTIRTLQTAISDLSTELDSLKKEIALYPQD